MRKMTMYVDEDVYSAFREMCFDRGEIPSDRIRDLIARDTLSQNILMLDLSRILTWIADHKTQNIDTLFYRRAFESSRYLELERDRLLKNASQMMSTKSREYQTIRKWIADSECLGSTWKGYPDMIYRTALGLACMKTEPETLRLLNTKEGV